MRLVAGEDDSGLDLLEPILPAGGGDDGDRGAGRPARPGVRRLVIALVAAALLVLLVAFPVRVKVDETRLRALEHSWLAARAVAQQRVDVMQALHDNATDADTDAVSRTGDALDLEVASSLEHRASALHGMFILDSKMRKTRDAMVKWMRLEAHYRRLHTPDNGGLTALTRINAERLVAADRQRLKLAPATLHSPQPTLHSADQLKLALSHYLDQPTGVRLLATDGVRIHNIDIDASTDVMRPRDRGQYASMLRGFPDPLILRSDYIAFVTEGGVFRIALSTQGEEQFLGGASWVFPAARPDATWLVTERPGSAYQLHEVDGNGTDIQGPYQLALRPVAEVSDGLLATTPTGTTIVVVNPATGKPTRTVAENAEYLAASATHVAWIAFDGPGRNTRIHVRSLVDNSETTHDDISDQFTVRARFSPDGRLLATVANTSFGPPQEVALRVFDVTTGTATSVSGAAGSAAINSVVWTPDSQRVFVATGDRFPLATWVVGDTRLRQLRMSDTAIQALVAVPKGS